MSSHQNLGENTDDSYLNHLEYDEVLFELCEHVKYIVNEIQSHYSESNQNATFDLTSAQKKKLKLAIIDDLLNYQYEFAKEKIKKLKELNQQQQQEERSIFDDGWDQALLEVCLKFEQLQGSNGNTSSAAMQL
ncbi:hypothetical protein O0L34_g17439 [Tuta absoluta]|nr:hypothetical protein O0L34_g17439 [Tuta absoluta]